MVLNEALLGVLSGTLIIGSKIASATWRVDLLLSSSKRSSHIYSIVLGVLIGVKECNGFIIKY